MPGGLAMSAREGRTARGGAASSADGVGSYCVRGRLLSRSASRGPLSARPQAVVASSRLRRGRNLRTGRPPLLLLSYNISPVEISQAFVGGRSSYFGTRCYRLRMSDLPDEFDHIIDAPFDDALSQRSFDYV